MHAMATLIPAYRSKENPLWRERRLVGVFLCVHACLLAMFKCLWYEFSNSDTNSIILE